MKAEFKRVILYARQHRANHKVNESLLRLTDFLTTLNINVVIEEDTAHYFTTGLPVLHRSDMGEDKDLMVVVGGDGSMLSAARLAIEVNVPVIGVNRGRLGFLTDISPLSIEEQLGAVINGSYEEEQRFLLQATIHDDTTVYFQGNALNDVFLSRGEETHLIDFDVYIDQQFVSHYRSDGMITATPTGSTAYALSAGGPIMHPKLNAIVLVPMFSHSLSSRPLVVDADVHIDLLISKRNEHELRLSCDGHHSWRVRPGEHVSIKKNKQNLRLLHPLEYHYYDTLRLKLGWESKYQG